MSAVNLFDLLPFELEALAESLGAPRYRGRQIATWLYKKSAVDIDAMSDLPRDFRRTLSERALVGVPSIPKISLDETIRSWNNAPFDKYSPILIEVALFNEFHYRFDYSWELRRTHQEQVALFLVFGLCLLIHISVTLLGARI
jgi:hypothetical protein